MPERFRDRRALVTGGAQGIGRAIVEALLAEGARVVIADVNGSVAEKTAQELAGSGEVTAITCDVRDGAQVKDTVREAEERLGGIDLLVNDAGVITMAECVDIPEEDWDHVMDVNAKGVFLMTQAALPGMISRGSGNIVNIASQAGKRGYKLFTHYCASKAAVIAFTKGVALEVAPNIRVNSVCPGVVNTDMMEREYVWEEEMTGDSKATIQDRWMAGIPMGRFQEPEHIARVVLFLASDDASEMTGQAINVTGGMVTE
jgi:meso-butanediol dehydrogenase / (S,S)-butanediol dehydrogenase / diacetyl reductase